MKFGLSEKNYAFIKKELTKLKSSDAKVWCFGSRARGDHQEFSDLDLMIESQDDLSSEISRLREEFEESNLPIKVDIVQEKDFAESYRPSYLKDRIPFM